MREIRFRAWIPDLELMEYAPQIRKKDIGNMNDIFIDDVVFLQYTGLKDKNGVEVYEGDIVKAKTDKDKYEYFEVAYYKQAFALRNKNGHKEYLCNLSCFNCLEVVGNIYENSAVSKGKENDN